MPITNELLLWSTALWGGIWLIFVSLWDQFPTFGEVTGKGRERGMREPRGKVEKWKAKLRELFSLK